jgi:tetratricopeptide (TPR) repeat protein
LLWEKGRRSEAVSAYEQTSVSAPGTTIGAFAKPRPCIWGVANPEAEEELRELISCDASNGVAPLLLGTVLQETGCFEEAAASFERSITIAPWQAAAYCGLASSKRFTKADRPWTARILARIDANRLRGRRRPANAINRLAVFSGSAR